MSDIKQIAEVEFRRQMNPDETEFECFFHYTDDKLFESGFVKGYELAKREANDVQTSEDKALPMQNVSVSVCPQCSSEL